MRDLWPDDIKSEDVISPEEILNHQASRLGERTGGLLAGHVVKHEVEDRVVLGFEVESARAGNRVRLFEVQHRLDFEYPAAIVPPDERLPDFLRDCVYKSGDIDMAGRTLQVGQWVNNPWVASSPTKFSEKVAELLGTPAVKGVVLSLLARARQGHSGGDPEADDP